MTVAELISELQKMPQDAAVYVVDHYCDCHDATSEHVDPAVSLDDSMNRVRL